MNLYKQWKKAIFKRNLLWERDIVQFSLSVRNARRYFIAKRRFLNGTADEIHLHVFICIYTKSNVIMTLSILSTQSHNIKQIKLYIFFEANESRVFGSCQWILRAHSMEIYAQQNPHTFTHRFYLSRTSDIQNINININTF